MNKQELEKMFDKKFGHCFNKGVIADNITQDNIKQFIFETIIPEVLKSVIPENEEVINFNCGTYADDPEYIEISGYNRGLENIKQKAKELYDINL